MGGEGTRGSSSESQKGAKEGGEGSSRHQGQEGPNQCEVLQATNLQARQGSKVPSQVHPQQEPHGRIQHHQAPLDHRVCHEEDRGQQHPCLHLTSRLTNTRSNLLSRSCMTSTSQR